TRRTKTRARMRGGRSRWRSTAITRCARARDIGRWERNRPSGSGGSGGAGMPAFAASARQPSRGLPSRSSRFDVSSRERRLVGSEHLMVRPKAPVAPIVAILVVSGFPPSLGYGEARRSAERGGGSRTSAAEQQTPSAQPRFQTSIDVTSLDVAVVDDRGRPIAGLAPADFAVRIDG